MEVRFMDKYFNTTKIVDAYTSCIWVDEYIGYGDFELVFPMNYSSLIGINRGAYASIRESDRYMVIEGIQIDTSVTEGSNLVVTGRSLECFLCDRTIKESTIISGSLQDGVHRLLNDNAINPDDANRIIPGLCFKKSDDPAITSLTLELELEPGDNLYDAIYAICDAYKIGFRVLPMENGRMEFELYAGLDRSYDQLTNPWVVFSPKFENLTESHLAVDDTNFKNTAYTDVEYKKQVTDSSGNVEEVDDILHVVVGNGNYGFERQEIYVSPPNVSVEEVDISQFGTAKSRVNIRDFQSWEPVYFDRKAYDEAVKKWQSKLESVRPTIKKEKKEWKSYWKEGSSEPGWQEEHPDEAPFYWVLETTPGDDAKTIAAKWDRYNAVADDEPSKDDFMRYGWVLTDPSGYQAAVDAAQAEINAEFAAAVADKVASAQAYVEEVLREKLTEYENITKFNGQVDSNVQFIFGRDYSLGDVVQIANEFDIQAVTRVTSMTFSQEPSTGFIMNPTFTSDNEAVFEI